MPRPYKSRRICGVPQADQFGPLGSFAEPESSGQQETVQLTLEEFETLRLIDLLDCTQQECADQMEVARTTVQAVYNSARKKVARALVYGCRLVIGGGNYRVCSMAESCCRQSCHEAGCGSRCCKCGGHKSGGCKNEDCSNI